MAKTVIAICCVFILAACVSPQQRAARDNIRHRKQCLSYGIKYGTEEFSFCTMKEAQIEKIQKENERQRIREEGREGLNKLSRQLQENQRRITNCYSTGSKFGVYTTCY